MNMKKNLQKKPQEIEINKVNVTKTNITITKVKRRSPGKTKLYEMNGNIETKKNM